MGCFEVSALFLFSSFRTSPGVSPLLSPDPLVACYGIQGKTSGSLNLISIVPLTTFTVWMT